MTRRSIKYIAALQAIGELDGQEQTELRNQLSAMLNFLPSGLQSNSNVISATNHDDWMIKDTIKFLSERGFPRLRETDLMNSAEYRAWTSKREAVLAFLRQGGNQTKQRMLFKMGLDCLVLEARERGWALNPRLVMRQLHRLPSLIDRMFPGYAENGLLHVIIKKGNKHVRKKRRDQPVQSDRREPSSERGILHTSGRGARRR